MPIGRLHLFFDLYHFPIFAVPKWCQSRLSNAGQEDFFRAGFTMWDHYGSSIAFITHSFDWTLWDLLSTWNLYGNAIALAIRSVDPAYIIQMKWYYLLLHP